MNRPRFRSSRLVLVGAVVSLLALSACSSSSSSSDTGSSGTSSSQAATEGLVGEPPTETVSAGKGVKAWIVSCGQSLTTCAQPSDAIAEAAKAIDWDADICDGKLTPDGWSSCIRQGTAQNADVIFVIGQDCSSFEGPLREAKAAGITTIGVGANDCDVAGGENLFSAITQRYEGMTNREWWNELGALQAEWLISQTGGELRVLEVQMSDALFGEWISEGFNAEIAACDTCEVTDTVLLTNQDSADGSLGDKFSSALLKASDANAVAVPLDSWFLGGITQAIQSSGRSGELAVVGAFGQQSNLDLIRSGQGEDATVAYDQTWEGWSGVDTALRVMAGQEVLPAGIGLQVVDSDHNLPAEGSSFSYVPEVDYKKLYRAVWIQS